MDPLKHQIEQSDYARSKQVVFAFADKLRSAETIDVDVARKVADQLRLLGALDLAADLYEKVHRADPEATDAAYLSNLLRSKFSSGAELSAGPARFYRIPDFLSAEAHKSVLRTSLASSSNFEPAEIRNSSDSRVDTNRRRGFVNQKIDDLRHLVLPLVKRAIHDNCLLSLFGFSDDLHVMYEFQQTCYQDGDFFCAHVDNSIPETEDRLISYVYYYRRDSESFTGGDLLLYDDPVDESNFGPVEFTRIQPEDNSIVFFISSTVHEVVPTVVPSGLFEDGRYSLNGWVVRA